MEYQDEFREVSKTRTLEQNHHFQSYNSTWYHAVKQNTIVQILAEEYYKANSKSFNFSTSKLDQTSSLRVSQWEPMGFILQLLGT